MRCVILYGDGIRMKKFWYSIKPVVYGYTVQYLLIIVGLIIYSFISGDTSILKNEENIYKYIIIGIIITTIPISIYLFKKYRVKEDKINFGKLLLMVPLGLSISLFYNMLTIKFQTGEVIDLNKVLLFLYLVIMAPLFEELLFRYVSLRIAKENYSEKGAVILTSLAFAFMHSGMINMIYAFIIGIVLCYAYIKNKNIMYPLVLHVSANLMSVLITEFSLIALIISFIILVILLIYLKKINHI